MSPFPTMSSPYTLTQEDGNLESLLADEFVLPFMFKPINGEEPK